MVSQQQDVIPPIDIDIDIDIDNLRLTTHRQPAPHNP